MPQHQPAVARLNAAVHPSTKRPLVRTWSVNQEVALVGAFSSSSCCLGSVFSTSGQQQPTSDVQPSASPDVGNSDMTSPPVVENRNTASPVQPVRRRSA